MLKRDEDKMPRNQTASKFPPLHVLVIDDDAETRDNLCDILELDNHEVETADSIASTLSFPNWSEISAVLLDRKLTDGTAMEVLPHIRELAPNAAIVIVTGSADLELAIQALHQGAADYILKPIDPTALRRSLQQIAERRHLALAKERSDAAFRTLIEAAPCLIVILDDQQCIRYFSRFAEEITGYTASEVLGKECIDLFLSDEQRSLAREKLTEVLTGQGLRGMEFNIRCKNGIFRSILWNAQKLEEYEGRPTILTVGQDITNLKKVQEKALQSERLAAIGQMMTGLAHESRNALARSQACLEMLSLEVPQTPEVTDLLQRVQRAQNHLQQLYEEVRSYAAPIKLNLENWDVSAVWRLAWENLQYNQDKKEAYLNERLSCMNRHCPLDQFRMEQVFRNIFDNSLAACPKPVQIDISCTECHLDSQEALEIVITDNGPGLTPEQKEMIFEPFFTTKAKGTGLGMAIAKRIVEQHGGQICVGQEPISGSQIIIRLPRVSP